MYVYTFTYICRISMCIQYLPKPLKWRCLRAWLYLYNGDSNASRGSLESNRHTRNVGNLSLDGKTKTGQFLAYLKWHSKTGLATLPHCPTSEAGTKGEQCHAECCTELQRATCSKSVVFTSESVWSFALQVSSKWYIVIYTGCMQHAAHLRSLYNFEYLHMLFSRETQIGWTSQVCEQRTLCKRSASHY